MDKFRRSAAQLDMHQFVRIVQQGSVRGKIPGFRAANSLAFPSSDINAFLDRDGREWIEFTCLGLHGVSSPLPHYFITDALDEENYSLREFLGIFNQQIYRAYFRAWEHKHPHLFNESCLLGQEMLASLASEEFDTNQNIPGLIELFLSDQRSMDDLHDLIKAIFPEIPFKIKIDHVDWIATQTPAQLGSDHARLNDSLTLGKRIPIRSHEITLELGPCPLEFIQSNQTIDWLIRYLNHALSITIHWKIMSNEGQSKLGDSLSLGWNSTLGHRKTDLLKVQHVYQPG